MKTLHLGSTSVWRTVCWINKGKNIKNIPNLCFGHQKISSVYFLVWVPPERGCRRTRGRTPTRPFQKRENQRKRMSSQPAGGRACGGWQGGKEKKKRNALYLDASHNGPWRGSPPVRKPEKSSSSVVEKTRAQEKARIQFSGNGLSQGGEDQHKKEGEGLSIPSYQRKRKACEGAPLRVLGG